MIKKKKETNKHKENKKTTHFNHYIRLEEQMRQKTRLINQFNYNIKERDDLLSKKEEALAVLENLEHTMVATTTQYVDIINHFTIVKKKNKS